jgi:type I restriction enzyme M protein
LTLGHFDELFALLGSRADSPRSWTVTRAEIEARGYDLKAVNPTAKAAGDLRTPTELLDEIEARGLEVDAAIARLRVLLEAEPGP